MAAGLSLSLEHYPAFQQAFDQTVKGLLSDQDLEELVLTDGALSAEELNKYGLFTTTGRSLGTTIS